ncbi:MAG: M60 family metallopeptidase, partial [Planctomycetota bacterium]
MAQLIRALLLAVLVAELGAAPLRPVEAREPAEEATEMLEGVKTIARPGIPGTLCVYGPNAFPIVAMPCGGDPAPMVAAVREGKGRAVAFGHTYTGDALAQGDTARFVANTLSWAAGKPRTIVRVGARGRNALAKHLPKDRFQVVALDGPAWMKGLDDVDVLVVSLPEMGDEEIAELRERLADGLGIVSGGPGWGWEQLNPGKDLRTEHAGNRLLAPYGLVWGAGFTEGSGLVPVEGPAPRLTHAGVAVEEIVDKRSKATDAEKALALATATRALRDLPPDDRWILPKLDRWVKSSRSRARVPRHDAPIDRSEPLARLELAREVLLGLETEPRDVRAHPAADVFPGAVPKRAKPVTRRVTIDLSVPDWHGTGLYAPPGELVHVHIVEGTAPPQLALRIGAHSDRLWDKPAWDRAPEITRTFPLDEKGGEAANAFGGLVYVVVPDKAAAGSLTLEISGAVEAPRFVLGQTTLEDWKKSIRDAPGPWAELEGTKVILTVPSSHVRRLDDPQALMTWWDRVMDACADLSQIPRERKRPERYVTDEQISVGYMHSGYPIMTHLDAAPRFVDLPTLSTKGDWGMFHEMGHNHQRPAWTFDGTVEVTCNLYSLYVLETVCAAGERHGEMSAEHMARNAAKFREGGAQFGTWKANPFIALICYDQLREAFGWEAFQRVFAEYERQPKAEQPTSDDAKRDQWLVRMSRAVGKNLGPFFASWSIPVSQAARDAVADLPEWMPSPLGVCATELRSGFLAKFSLGLGEVRSKIGHATVLPALRAQSAA